MADITDIKSILYTEKTLGLQEKGVVVVQTSTRMTKNSLKSVFREYFGVTPSKINSLRQEEINDDFPFHYLNPEFCHTSGGNYWFKKFNDIIELGNEVINGEVSADPTKISNSSFKMDIIIKL